MLLLLGLAHAAPASWALAPFGVGVYVHDRPARGVLYTVTQAVGFTALAWGSVRADAALDAGNDQDYYRWEGVSALGATVGFGSWIVSAVDTGRLHELEATAATARLRTWDAQLLLARGPTDD